MMNEQAQRAGRSAKPDLKSLMLSDIEALVAEMKEPGYRAAQIASWVFDKGVGTIEEMTNLSKALRVKLQEYAHISQLKLAHQSKSRRSPTTKFLFELEDRQTVETVLIGGTQRNTICISTQVGCAIGCRFCASGLAGLVRNMTTSEIIDQVIQARRIFGDKRPINNVVIMGMGEPLANYKNVMQAVRVLNAPWGLGIGARKITLSTSGLVPKIYDLAKEHLQFELSVSLHAADDKTRSLIVPINKQYPIKPLMKACHDYVTTTNRVITFEYVLLHGVNDRFADVKNLAALLRNTKYKLNIIPYNPVAGLPFETPSERRQTAFVEALQSAVIKMTVRRERGRDIDAACGQLRLNKEKQVAGA